MEYSPRDAICDSYCKGNGRKKNPSEVYPILYGLVVMDPMILYGSSQTILLNSLSFMNNKT
jgi:hypothetical protein